MINSKVLAAAGSSEITECTGIINPYTYFCTQTEIYINLAFNCQIVQLISFLEGPSFNVAIQSYTKRWQESNWYVSWGLELKTLSII